MKNKLIALSATVIAAVCALFGGCSCSGEGTLSFSGGFINSVNREVVTYSVTYQDSYGEIKKGADLGGFTFAYGEGEFVSEFTLTGSLPSGVTSDLLQNAVIKDKPFYKLTSNFSIPITVSVNGVDYNNTETVTTETYISGSGASFAPLYAKEVADYLIIINTSPVQVIRIQSETETFYNEEFYSKTVKSVSYIANETPTVTLDNAETEEFTQIKYSFRSAIDNAELLFALRGLSLDEKAYTYLPTISPSYDKAVSLRVSNTSNASGAFNVKYSVNGEEVFNGEQTLSYSEYDFNIDSKDASGIMQYVKIQSAASEKIPNGKYMLQYVKPLTTYGTYTIMGALVFTVKEISATN